MLHPPAAKSELRRAKPPFWGLFLHGTVRYDAINSGGKLEQPAICYIQKREPTAAWEFQGRLRAMTAKSKQMSGPKRQVGLSSREYIASVHEGAKNWQTLQSAR